MLQVVECPFRLQTKLVINLVFEPFVHGELAFSGDSGRMIWTDFIRLLIWISNNIIEHPVKSSTLQTTTISSSASS